jgi:hypothetical protein
MIYTNVEVSALAVSLSVKIAAGLVGFGAMVALALLVTWMIWVPALLKAMASRNFLIGMCDEGTAKAVMHYSEFERAVMSWKGHHLTPEWEVVADFENPEKAPTHWMDKVLPGSLFWIGLPFSHSVYDYHFQWTSLRQGVLERAEAVEGGLQAIVQQEKLEDLLISRDKMLDYVITKDDIYVIRFQDIEDKEMIPLSSLAPLTIRVRNVYRALFASEQWLEQVTNFLRSYVKDYIGNKEFSELAKAKSKVQSDEILNESSPTDNVSVKDYILNKWGVEILHLNLVNIDPGGKRHEAYETAAATAYLKKQEAAGIREIADAEAYRASTVAAALKDDPNALIVRTLEAYETMGENGNVIVLGGENPVNMFLNSTKAKEKK